MTEDRLLLQSLRDFLKAESLPITRQCPACGSVMEYLDATFFIGQSDGSWDVPLPICFKCAAGNENEVTSALQDRMPWTRGGAGETESHRRRDALRRYRSELIRRRATAIARQRKAQPRRYTAPTFANR